MLFRSLSNSGSVVKLSWPNVLAGFTVVYEVVTGVAAGSLQGSVQSARASQGIRRALRTAVRLATKSAGSPLPSSRRGRGLSASWRNLGACCRVLCLGARLLLRPAEGLAADQHLVQDHRQLARQRPITRASCSSSASEPAKPPSTYRRYSAAPQPACIVNLNVQCLDVTPRCLHEIGRAHV